MTNAQFLPSATCLVFAADTSRRLTLFPMTPLVVSPPKSSVRRLVDISCGYSGIWASISSIVTAFNLFGFCV
jgi:hypothetical protein